MTYITVGGEDSVRQVLDGEVTARVVEDEALHLGR